jgi:DNA topoisomerase IA
MSVTIVLTKEFLDGFEQSVDTAMENLARITLVEMKKLAPFAQPSQYPGGYRGTPGSLMKSLEVRGKGKDSTIESGVPYARRRNYENNLNPQTKHYVERSIDNISRGSSSQWWQAS